ncbi:MAG: plasmid replication protein RepC [Litoreibacter sp.]|nr:plasmid replication protein RepC [Litoreibacter sp.]
MQNTGWRKPTPGLGVAEQLAQAGKQMNIPKTRAFVAVKRVGAHINLKAGDMMLLDTLGAFTQPQDWEEGQRPIVWPSNAYLMEHTGFSLSALKRHARRLAEAGIIAFKDSSNGKRWGKRDENGVILEAYGFDLSPLAARVEEFEELQADLAAERELCQLLRRKITVSRRMIRARLDAAISSALSGPWSDFQQSFEALLGKLPRRPVASSTLERLLRWLVELQEQVEEAFLVATRATSEQMEVVHVDNQTQEMNPKQFNNEPHILTTNHLTPVISNCSEKEHAAGVEREPQTEERVEKTAQDERSRPNGVAIDVPTIMQACPEFATWARDLGGYLKDWGDVYRVAGELRPMIGVSEHAWLAAQESLGKQAAAAAMVLVFDKHAKGEVASPGGYLRGMVEKAGAGELHLERSIFGRLGAQAA